jgi:hypothetical protein
LILPYGKRPSRANHVGRVRGAHELRNEVVEELILN